MASIKYLRKQLGDDCYLCGKVMEFVDFRTMKATPLSATRDHVVPLALGGAQYGENVKLAHQYCNNLKSNLPPEQWAGRWPMFREEEELRRAQHKAVVAYRKRRIIVPVRLTQREYDILRRMAGDKHPYEYLNRKVIGEIRMEELIA